jgi:ABC-type branched-subunit amino acid transport system ATPase component
MNEPLLQAQEVRRSFGGVHAVKDVSLAVGEGQIDGLIGPNGAGKSTMLALIAGAIRPDAGSIRFLGQDVTSWSTARRARLGLVRTFQAASPIPGLTARENVLVGYTASYRAGFASTVLRTPAMRREARAFASQADALLEYCGLAADADRFAGELSFGKLRLLEVARALAASPKLVLLDEPGAGLNRMETERLAQLLRRVRDGGTSVLVVDHDVSFLFGLCDQVSLLDFGTLVLSDTAGRVRDSSALRSVYLGAVPVSQEEPPSMEAAE